MKKLEVQEKITIWVADVRERWNVRATSRLLQCIPEADCVRIRKYRRWLDIQMSVAGLLMIGTVMRRNSGESILSVLTHLTRSPGGRPSLPFGPDFNVAHSGGIVVLAAVDQASGVRVGIDIEVILDAWEDLLGEVLTCAERSVLSATDKPKEEFYRIWTYKEAVVKADGRGLAVPLNHISSLNASVLLDGTRWSVKSLAAPPGYAAHLAASCNAAIDMKAFSLNDRSFECMR